MMIPIHDYFLYELLEDYQNEQNEKEREAIFQSFCSAIWNSFNVRHIYHKSIRYYIKKSLAATDLGAIFSVWSDVEYLSVKRISKETDFISLIRQKVNNLYTRYFDPSICLKREYLELLKTPKRLYYEWQSGTAFSPEEATRQIDDAMEAAELVKKKYGMQKMELSWEDYQTFISGCFRKLFNNYVPSQELPKSSSLYLDTDLWGEDNLCISYFCKSLDGYLKDYQKCYYHLSKRGKNERCVDCGTLFKKHANNQLRCPECQFKKRLLYKAEKQRLYRKRLCGQAENPRKSL